MPPLKITPKILKFEHDIVEERTGCAALLGGISSAYSILEIRLAIYFVQIANVSIDYGHGMSDIALSEAFDSVSTLAQKIEMILIVSRRRFDEQTVDKIDAVLKKVQESGRKRNKMVHARWMLADEYPDSVLYRRRFGSDMTDIDEYNETKLRDKLNSINGARKELDVLFLNEILPRLKAIRE